MIFKSVLFKENELDEYSKKLPKQFVRCHKSYVVNMDHIIYIDKELIRLKNEMCVSISKARHKEFRERYFLYMAEKM